MVSIISWSLFAGLVIVFGSSLRLVQSQELNQTGLELLLFGDTSNDDAIRLSASELLTRSGFKFEKYYVISDDGYITLLLRIMNPLAAQLRKPPVMLHHGANIDQASYLCSSSIQHHPEPYPRTASSGSFTSSNRSLGFVLANNGYDVFLIGTRGSNFDNQRYTSNKTIQQQIRNGDFSAINNNVNDPLFDFAKTSKYWQYGQDDVAKSEIKVQMDKVMSITNSTEVFMYTYSLSTTTTLAFLAQNPDYAQRVRVYFQMGPAIVATHFTAFDTLYFEKISPLTPTRGIGFFPSYTIQPIIRELLIATSINPAFKYSFIYALTTQIFGPSPQFQTFLERNMISHIFQPVSYKTVQQYSQNSVYQNFSKFDYGTLFNPKYYGTTYPPVYNISNLEVQQWAIVSGTNDGLADPNTVQKLARTVKTPNPPFFITGPQYNHLDLIAAYNNDKYINLPVLALLNRYNS